MTLREAREKHGYSQTHVAREVGVSLTAYLLWEREVSTPKPENQEKLITLLNLPTEFFS